MLFIYKTLNYLILFSQFEGSLALDIVKSIIFNILKHF